MIEKDTLIKVTNRNNGSASYSIPDLGNLRRRFSAGETKEITMEELRKLSYLPGGAALLRSCLLVHNEEAVKELLSEVEPEYYYTKKEVAEVLEKGSLDELKDLLDFAPKGTINLVKEVAVETELNDVKKRDAILESSGFDVTNAIFVDRETSEEREEEKKERRVKTAEPAKMETATTPGRRTTPKYNVVSRQ